jgi:hypothetical protein
MRNDISSGPMAGVTQAYQHTNPFHLGNNSASERGQAMIFLVATAAEQVGPVVRDQHPAHPKVSIEFNQADLPVDRTGPFDVEADRHTPRCPRRYDGTRRIGDQIPIRMGSNPVTKAREHTHVLSDALLCEADIQSYRIKSGPAMPLQLRQKRYIVRSQRHTGVMIPNERVCDQSPR